MLNYLHKIWGNNWYFLDIVNKNQKKNQTVTEAVIQRYKEIAPTFLKLDSWSPGAWFIPIKYTKGINQKRKLL